jgi:hypothetical protein
MHGIINHHEYLVEAAKRARAGNKPLIHSLSEARELIFDVIDRIGARSVCEIGSEGGLMSEELHARYRSGKLDRLTVIDPFPTQTVASYGDDRGCKVLAQLSSDALPDLPAHDVYIIDGDHNFFTVYGELKQVLKHENALVIMHDISWPWAHRDLYYDASVLPDSAKNDPVHGAIHPSSSGIVPHGFDGRGQYTVAAEEGGDTNGVFRAVVAISQEVDIAFSSVPALFGIGFVRSQSFAHEAGLSKALDFSAIEPLLYRLEENRLTTYLRVIELEAHLHERNVELVRINKGRLSLFEFAKIFGRFVLGGFLSKGR